LILEGGAGTRFAEANQLALIASENALALCAIAPALYWYPPSPRFFLQIVDELVGGAALPAGASGVFVHKIALIFCLEVEVIPTIGVINLL
jgi:hypothetical protein